MKQSKGPGGKKVARLVRVQILVRKLARKHEWIGDAIRSATAEFPRLVKRQKAALQVRNRPFFDPPDPNSLDFQELRQLPVTDLRTVILYRLGGLADTGSLSPIVPPPKTTGDPARAMNKYLAWSRRLATSPTKPHTGNPTPSTDSFPPELAEQFLAELKEWVREHAGKDAASGEVVLTADHESILAVLGKTPTKRKTVIDVASAGTIRNRETVGRLLSELEEAGLVDRLYGKRKGYALTDAGRKRLPGASLT